MTFCTGNPAAEYCPYWYVFFVYYVLVDTIINENFGHIISFLVSFQLGNIKLTHMLRRDGNCLLMLLFKQFPSRKQELSSFYGATLPK